MSKSIEKTVKIKCYTLDDLYKAFLAGAELKHKDIFGVELENSPKDLRYYRFKEWILNCKQNAKN